jgi:hypothetical protein
MDSKTTEQPELDRTGFSRLTTSHLLALSSFSISQPIYDVLANSPELFTSYGVDGIDLVFFAVIVSFAVPTVLISLTGIAALISSQFARIITRIFIGILLFLYSMLLLRDIGTSAYFLFGLAGLLSTSAFLLLRTFQLTRLWLSWLSIGAIAFPALFFVNPNITPLLVSPDTPIQATFSNAKHPVFLVVFDKLPTSILINEQYEIDSVRFPNFSALADNATWFRNNTTSAQDTISSMPTILTGKYPDDRRTPNLANFPENMFVLLKDSFNLNILEYVTKLNPEDTGSYIGDQFTILKSMIADVFLVYLHVILPEQQKLQLPSIEGRTYNFWDAFSAVPKSGSKRMDSFIARIKAEKPWLHYLHIDLPHGPFRYRASGTVYTKKPSIPGLAKSWGKWGPDQTPIDKSTERYLQHVHLSDNLLGDLITHLKTLGIYNESLIVLTSDHGGGFLVNNHTRAITRKNYLDVLYVPLFIKMPGQIQGLTSDINSELIDIFPTIVDALTGQIPWDVDGVSLFDVNRKKTGKFARANLQGKTDLYEFPSENGGEFMKLRPLTMGWTWNKSDRHEYALEAESELIGQPFNSVKELFYDANIEEPGFALNPELSPLDNEFEITNGWLRGPVIKPANLPEQRKNYKAAILLDGKIISITRLLKHKDHPLYVAELLPEKYTPLLISRLKLRILK